MTPRIFNVGGRELLDAIERHPEGVLSLDAETTGLAVGRDGVLSLSIVNARGDTVYDTLVHTYKRRTWRDAQHIHHISPRDVRDAPSVAQIRGDVFEILSSADILVGYNVSRFDLPMMIGDGFEVPDLRVYDAYLEYVCMTAGEGSHRLVDCAARFGIPFKPHTSLGDAGAALECAIQIAGGRP